MIPFSCAAASPFATCSAASPFAERHAFEQFADDVRRPALVADVVNRQQVGMIEHPGRARFLLEALHAFLIAERERGQDFDGHVASEARVFGAIDRTHAALAEKAHDPIGTEHGIRLEHWRPGMVSAGSAVNAE